MNALRERLLAVYGDENPLGLSPPVRAAAARNVRALPTEVFELAEAAARGAGFADRVAAFGMVLAVINRAAREIIEEGRRAAGRGPDAELAARAAALTGTEQSAALLKLLQARAFLVEP